MADLKINIVTKYDQAEKGFNKVSGSLQKYRKELIEASKSGQVTDEQIQNYVDALNRCLTAQDLTKEGMAALNAQARLLKGEMGQIGLTFGEQGELYKKMSASLKDVKAQMKDVGTVSNSASSKLLSVAKNILKFQLLMGPITAAIRGFKNTLSDSVKVAAEAEQKFNKLATVFDGFEDSAKKMASSLASALGVATSTSASALSTVGDLLQAQGMGTAQSLSKASSWVKQFQDIIAFKDINMSLEEFAQNFMSGAAGNLRNFRTFGSIVKESAVNARLAAEGLDKLTGSQLELAKMTTRATMALEQQKNAMGATEREWDTTLSVSRRLSEAWKEYKENLGDTINSVLTPLKSSFAALFDQINKAKRAQKEFNSGNRNIKVYDIYNNGEDSASFQYSLSSAYNEYRTNRNFAGQTLDGTVMGSELDAFNAAVRTVDSIIVKFGATVATVQSVMGDKLTPEMYKELRALEKIRIAENKRLEAIETRRGNISISTDAYEAFTETLKAIAGASGISTPDWASVSGQFAGIEGGDKVYAGNVAASMMKAVSDALEAINGADLAEAFGDVISGALDELDEKGLREAQVESLRKLFEASWNQFAEGGFTDDEKAKLEEIKTSYKQATAALEEYNKKLQIQNSILSFKSGLGSIETQTRQIGMTDEQKALDDLRMSYHELTKDANLMTNEELDDLELSYNRQIVAIRTLYKLQNEYNSKLEREAAIKSYIDKTADYRTQLANIGLTDRQIEYNRMNEEARAAWNSGDMDLYKTIVETIQAFNDLNVALDEAEEAEKRRAALEDLMDKVNPFASTMEAYSLGQSALGGGVMAGIAGVLADILANTEAFQKLASIVTDHIVPVLDAFLEPLLPVIDVIGDLMQSLVMGILVPMFPLIVEICALVTLVVGTIKNIADLIVNTIKKVIGSLGYGIMRALDKLIIGDQSHWYEGTWMDQWRNLTPWETFKNAQEQLLDQVKEIRGLTFDIKENTDDKDLLATLKELYSRGIIDEQQFYAGARVKQKDMIFDPVSPTGDHYITNGDITIYVNGGDPSELRRTLEQFFDENNMHYNMAYGRA